MDTIDIILTTFGWIAVFTFGYITGAMVFAWTLKTKMKTLGFDRYTIEALTGKTKRDNP